MNTEDAEAILDGHPQLTALPVNARRTPTSYTSGYETPSGRHLVLDRRGSKGFARIFVENKIDPGILILSAASRHEHYGPNRSRVGIERASKRLAGPKDGNPGTDAICFWLDCEKDIRSLLQTYLNS